MTGIFTSRIVPARAAADVSPIITSLEWDGDLSELPLLKFAADLSTGCTEAQALAALSIDSSGLLIDTQDAVDAGADATFEMTFWLGEPALDPMSIYWRVEMLSAKGGVVTSGVGLLAYYLADGVNAGGGPPGASEPYAGALATNNHGARMELLGQTSQKTGGSHMDLHTQVSRYAGASYALTYGVAYTGSRSHVEDSLDPRSEVIDATYSTAARWRPALALRRFGGASQQQLRIDRAHITWQPSPDAT